MRSLYSYFRPTSIFESISRTTPLEYNYNNMYNKCALIIIIKTANKTILLKDSKKVVYFTQDHDWQNRAFKSKGSVYHNENDWPPFNEKLVCKIQNMSDSWDWTSSNLATQRRELSLDLSGLNIQHDKWRIRIHYCLKDNPTDTKCFQKSSKIIYNNFDYIMCVQSSLLYLCI